MKPIEKVLEKLEGVKEHNGFYRAFCPAHGDAKARERKFRDKEYLRLHRALGTVKGIVNLSPPSTLDKAQDFLAQHGYEVVHRTGTTLTAQRRSAVSSNEQGTPNLVVSAIPQPEGGVRDRLTGADHRGVDERQHQWMEWAESLLKRA